MPCCSRPAPAFRECCGCPGIPLREKRPNPHLSHRCSAHSFRCWGRQHMSESTGKRHENGRSADARARSPGILRAGRSGFFHRRIATFSPESGATSILPQSSELAARCSAGHRTNLHPSPGGVQWRASKIFGRVRQYRYNVELISHRLSISWQSPTWPLSKMAPARSWGIG